MNSSIWSSIKSQTIHLVGTEAFLSSQSFQKRAAILDRKPKLLLLLNLLLLCGDINLNPGPNWKFPCGFCSKPVKCNQMGIQCDSCDTWLHSRCLDMNLSDYEILANSSCTWICPNCDCSNFSNSILESSLQSWDSSNSFEPLSSIGSSTPLIRTSSKSSSSSSPILPNCRKASSKFKKTKLKGMIINCNGLKSTSRFTEFQALLDLHDPDFVLGTESKLQEDISSSSIFPTNYTIFRKDRNSYGGGVFQAVRSDLICVEEPDFNTDCEIIWTSLKLSNCKTLYLSSVYRPPNSSILVLDHIHDSINHVFTKNASHPNVIIGGDFNLGDIDWNSDVPVSTNTSSTQQSDKLLHLIEDFSLSQHVKSTTRPASDKILDLLLSTFPNSVSNVSTKTGISDHLAVTFDVNLKPKRARKPSHKVYVYKRADFDGLNNHMEKASTSFFMSNPDERSVDENWSTFKLILQDGINKFIPQRNSKPKYNLPWITNDIKRNMRKKDRLYKKAIQTKCPGQWNDFKKQRNKVSKLVKEAHNEYLNEVIGSSLSENPKKFWSYVKSCKSENIGIPPLKDGINIKISNKDKAETMNNYFHSVFTKERLPIPEMAQSPYSSVADLQFNPVGVAKQLSALNPRKACGPDELPTRVLKEVAESVSRWLCYLFQQSYNLNSIPRDWSKATVTAVFKKDNKSNPANYRPISLTCICCKIMEHIVLSHMAKHLAVNNIIINEQHGFRKSFSCETQLITAIHDWATSINQKSQTDVILLDFSKAFDSVPHKRLLTKLNFYGFRGNTLKWIEAFLSNRSQVVSVNGTKSSPKEVTSGVPQGSVLGPVLFLLFINDITSNIKSNLRLFADDCIIYREMLSDDDHHILQQDLNLLSAWSITWQLNFNVTKCYHLGITLKKSPCEHSYALLSQSIPCVNSTTYLGITITDNLRWNAHIDKICKKANSTLGLLKRILSGCTTKVKSQAYLSMVRPKLEYASCAWNPYTKRNINKIEMVQRRSARFVFHDYSRYSHVSPMLESLGWDTLEQRRLMSQANMFYKIHQNQVGIQFPDEIIKLNRKSRLPNIYPYRQLQCNNDIYKFSFYPRTIITWNNLHLPTLPTSIEQFKNTAISSIYALA